MAIYINAKIIYLFKIEKIFQKKRRSLLQKAGMFSGIPAD